MVVALIHLLPREKPESKLVFDDQGPGAEPTVHLRRSVSSRLTESRPLITALGIALRWRLLGVA